MRGRVGVQISQAQKSASISTPANISPNHRPIIIRAISEMLTKSGFQPLNFPGTLSKRIL
ncbi:hypothetical protein CDG79_06670 [Nostoc sp. 'Peltigera membranacea cyanobiont' 232]|nr:hypothetical protein CDG79_06670 [Nostoc sp. 'Peltigera membranacea cyanobiont' 232]